MADEEAATRVTAERAQAKAEKAKRLAAAMRENLKKRKAQEAARKAAEAGDG